MHFSTLLLVLPCVSPALAFMPTKQLAGFSWLGYTHSEITHDAMRSLTKDIYTEYRTKTMRRARKDAAHANADVDHDFHTSEKHFDGESLPEGQLRLWNLRSNVITLLREARDSKGARVQLGEALHTLQDFYSHSNWIEMGMTGVNQIMGLNYQFDRLPHDHATCQDCEQDRHEPKCPDCSHNVLLPFGSGLVTTGYYSSETRVKPGNHKCSHGGAFDKSTSLTGGGINKDTVKCHMSPHHSFHWAAVHMATEGSRKFMMDIMKELTAAETGALLGALPEIAIAYENPRIAGAALQFAQTAQKHFHHKRAAGKGQTDSEIMFIMPPLSEVDELADVKTTSDAKKFESSLSNGNSKLNKRGGSDAGILVAMNTVPSGADFLVFRDHEKERIDREFDLAIANKAAARNIRIFPVSEKANDADAALARLTGGQMLTPDLSQALVSWLIETNLVTIYRSNDDGEHKVPVDASVSALVITGASSIRQPDGEEVNTEGIISQPQSGVWVITSDSELSVTGLSDIRIDDFEITQFGGRSGHTGFFPVQNVLSGNHYVATSTAAGLSSPSFQLLSNGEGVKMDMVRAENLTDLSANVTLAKGEYSLVMTGKDNHGNQIRRQWEVPVISSDYAVSIHGMILVEDDVADVKINILSNKSGNVRLNLNVDNSAYKIVGGEEKSVSVKRGQETEVSVKVKLGPVEKGSCTISAVLNVDGGMDIVASRMLPLIHEIGAEQLKEHKDGLNKGL